MIWKSDWLDLSFIIFSELQSLHYYQSARIKMPQSKNHATVQFGLLIANVTRISAVSTVSCV